MSAPSTQPRAPRQRSGIACISSAPWNPYLELLYEHLAASGLVRVPEQRFTLGWLWRCRREVAVLHFHWPEGYYRHQGSSRALRGPLSWLKLALFAIRLSFARGLGYRIGWTVHQVYPHDRRSGRLDRAGARVLARLSNVLLANDRATAATATRELKGAGAKLEVIPHGSYIGVYPPGRSRPAVRAELGLGADDLVFLCFGELRRNKGIELLLRAWAEAKLGRSSLVVAGNPKDVEVRHAVEAAAKRDSRIKPLLGFRSVETVAELFGACDVSVLARSDGGTSGSFVLALSLGLPVVFPDQPAYGELTAGANPGWRFRPGDASSLRDALERATADPARARELGHVALEIASRLRWPEIAERTAAALVGGGR